jgi:hypothetical protein
MRLSLMPALPLVCHRCKRPLPERARICPNCMMEQREIVLESILNYVLVVVLVMITVMVPLGWVLYHFAQPG